MVGLKTHKNALQVILVGILVKWWYLMKQQ